MDKIFSTRIDETTIQRIAVIATILKTSKKAVIERAITLLADEVQGDNRSDVFQQTSGAWKREEPITQTIEETKNDFSRSFGRNQS